MILLIILIPKHIMDTLNDNAKLSKMNEAFWINASNKDIKETVHLIDYYNINYISSLNEFVNEKIFEESELF